MKFTEENIKILKSLTSLSDIMCLQPDEIRVKAKTGKVSGIYTWGKNELEKDIPIMSITKLIAILNYYGNDVDIKINDNSFTVGKDKEKTNMRFTTKDIVERSMARSLNELYEKFIKEYDEGYKCEFILKENQFKNIVKQCSILGDLEQIKFENNLISLANINYPSTNSYTLELDEVKDKMKLTVIDNEYFVKFVPSDYKVKLYANCMLFESLKYNLKYIHLTKKIKQ